MNKFVIYILSPFAPPPPSDRTWEIHLPEWPSEGERSKISRDAVLPRAFFAWCEQIKRHQKKINLQK